MFTADVWCSIFSYLTHRDVIEVSACWKVFHCLPKWNKRFVEKLFHSRSLFSGATMFDHYKDVCFSFVAQLSHALNDYFDEDTFFDQKNCIMDKLIFNMLPFRVFNHLFSCSRSCYCSDVCFFCTRFNVKQKRPLII